MRYVTTNIRLPEDLWKSLKMEAAHHRKRLSEIIRERLKKSFSLFSDPSGRKPKSLYGLWKGVKITDADIEEAKRSLFPK